jgi:polysaccharide pyruvyl transferase WcaK-like protein
MKKVLILSSNFCGNIGDVFIFESIVDYVISIDGGSSIDVYPYPSRDNSLVSLPLAVKYKNNVEFIPPLVRLRGGVEHYMRKFSFLNSIISKIYFNKFYEFLRSSSCLEDLDGYDVVIVAGGEMDIPFSQLDVHAYIRSLPEFSKVIYGPVSISCDVSFNEFILARFSEVDSVAIRDPLSLSRLEKAGVRNATLVPDCAFLSFNKEINRTRDEWSGHIGVCLHSTWGYKKELLEFINAIISAAGSIGSKVTFFCTHAKEDEVVIKKICGFIADSKIPHIKSISVVVPSTTEELSSLFLSMDLVISDRLHGILIGMINGCNILPLVTRDKVEGYCKYLELESFIKGIENQDELSEVFLKCSENYKALRLKHRDFMVNASSEVKSYYRSNLV